MILATCAVLVALGVRLAYIEAAMRPGLLPLAARQQAGTRILHARRGLILDRRGRVLAGSDEADSVFLDPTRIDDLHDTAVRVAPILGQNPSKIVAHLRQRIDAKPDTEYVLLKRELVGVEAEAVRGLRLSGVGTQALPRRRYPMGRLGAHVLGFMRRDGHGLEGVEHRYDSLLRGRDGRIEGLRANGANRRWIWMKPGGYEPPRDGRHIVLTLDAVIQSIVEAKLTARVAKYRAESGVGIVMSPKTGEVLALASVPTFDPNRRSDTPRATWRNRALTDPVEPGSTFKPFIAATAVQEGVVRWDEVVFCHNGLYMMGRRAISEYTPAGYGSIPFEMVIVKSSNIGMVQIGERLGNERLREAVRNFGFGERTGIELAGEDAGLVWPLSVWTSYSTGSIPMGQEVSVTLIQLARAFCALANGGLLLRPRVVKAVLDVEGNVIESHDDPVVVRRVLSESVAASTRRTLAKVVAPGGTGWRAQLDAWQLIGKTGTAQIARKGGRGYGNGHQASFVCAGPARDPEVVTLIMIRKPDRSLGLGYAGGIVSAPVAGEIMGEVLAYLGVPPDPESPAAARQVRMAASR